MEGEIEDTPVIDFPCYNQVLKKDVKLVTGDQLSFAVQEVEMVSIRARVQWTQNKTHHYIGKRCGQTITPFIIIMMNFYWLPLARDTLILIFIACNGY